MLKEVSIGWHWLEKTLNTIIAEVNANKPLESTSIAIDHQSSGSMLRVIEQNKSQRGTQSGGGGGSDPAGGQWIAVNVVDANCNKSTIYVWGKLS